MPLSWLVFVAMVVVMVQANQVPPPAAHNTSSCSVSKDEKSFLSTLLTVTGFSERCVAAALDVCESGGQKDSGYASLMQEAREVVQQLSAVVTKLDSHLSTSASVSDSDPSAAVNESDSQPSAAMSECVPQASVSINNWESNISSAANLSQPLPRHCKDLLESGDSGRGLRQVYPYPHRPMQGVTVYCDQETDGGGWTVFQRRTSDAVRQNFYRYWTQYEFGFGELQGEFWMGLSLLHQLTTTMQQLRIDLDDYEGGHRYAKYNYFHVSGPGDNYRLAVESYSGDAGNSLTTRHNGQPFSTRDRDNNRDSRNCAERRKGAWWYGFNCLHSNLNGYQHVGSDSPHKEGIVWYHWRGWEYSLKRVSMMIRPSV